MKERKTPVFRGIRARTLLLVICFAALILIIFIWGSLIGESDLYVDLDKVFLKPSADHIFGTDWVGRDMLLRTVKGLSLSIKIGVLCSVFSCAMGMILGILAPLIGGWVDTFVNWLVDLVLSIPHTLVVILVSIACGGGLRGLIIGVVATHWTSLTRVIRAEVLQIKESEYTKVSRKFGKSTLYIAREHIFPQVIPQLVVGVVLIFPHAILHEASLTFLGFGLPAHEPAIGIILSESMKYITSGKWWLAVFPGAALICISLIVSSIGRNIQKLISPSASHR